MSLGIYSFLIAVTFEQSTPIRKQKHTTFLLYICSPQVQKRGPGRPRADGQPHPSKVDPAAAAAAAAAKAEKDPIKDSKVHLFIHACVIMPVLLVVIYASHISLFSIYRLYFGFSLM